MKSSAILLTFVCATFMVATGWAQTTEVKNLTASEGARHVGEVATVTDQVTGIHQSGKGNIFLNMGGKYPNQAFTAYIPASSAGQFSDFQKYKGTMVAVSGKITLYRGKPEIIVTSPSQITTK
jgi:DNA/RNA endonuclease YhcR with UshA esterase domain